MRKIFNIDKGMLIWRTFENWKFPLNFFIMESSCSKTMGFPLHFVFFFELKILNIWKYDLIHINENKNYCRILIFLINSNWGNSKGEINENIEVCLWPQLVPDLLTVWCYDLIYSRWFDMKLRSFDPETTIKKL